MGPGGAGTRDQGGCWVGRRGAGPPATIGGPLGRARPLHDPLQRPPPGRNHRHFLPVLHLPFITPSAGNPRGEGMTGCRLRARSGCSCPAARGLPGQGLERSSRLSAPVLGTPLTGRGVLGPKAGQQRRPRRPPAVSVAAAVTAGEQPACCCMSHHGPFSFL